MIGIRKIKQELLNLNLNQIIQDNDYNCVITMIINPYIMIKSGNEIVIENTLYYSNTYVRKKINQLIKNNQSFFILIVSINKEIYSLIDTVIKLEKKLEYEEKTIIKSIDYIQWLRIREIKIKEIIEYIEILYKK